LSAKDSPIHLHPNLPKEQKKRPYQSQRFEFLQGSIWLERIIRVAKNAPETWHWAVDFIMSARGADVLLLVGATTTTSEKAKVDLFYY
jgi:hypothetical protein